MRYAVCYDSTDDGRRTKLVKVLDDYGYRVQRSVFEFELDAETLEQILERLRDVVEPASDSVIVYRLCGACEEAVQVFGVDRRFGRDAVIIV